MGTVVACLAAVAPGAAPASADGATSSSVTMVSERGDYIGGGVSRLYHPGNATIRASGDSAHVSIHVSGGTPGATFDLNFAPPRGQELRPGAYEGAQRWPFHEDGRPAIDVSGDGRGCNTVKGRFQVKDISFGPTGELERLRVLYEHRCEGGTSALFGEVRVAMPSAGTLGVFPSGVRWPAVDIGEVGTPTPVTLVGGDPLTTVRSATLSGGSAAFFDKRLDECSGKTLTAGEVCEIYVRYLPQEPGGHSTSLEIDTSQGRTTVPLEGLAHDGVTGVVLKSDEGDFIGGGRTYVYTPANSSIDVEGSRTLLRFNLRGEDGDYWWGEFQAPRGDILVPGDTYRNATRYPFNGTGAGISVTGNSRGCNENEGEFTVEALSFDLFGDVRTAGVSFEQHCEGEDPALVGGFYFRVPESVFEGPGPGPPTPAPPGSSPRPGTGASGPPSALAPPRTPGPLVFAPGTRLSRSERRSICSGRRFSASQTLTGGRGRDRFTGSSRSDLIFTRGGADRVRARGGDDCLHGGSGADRLEGGRGKDVLAGGSGNDRLAGGPGRDRIDCGPGRDVARVQPGDRVRRCERVLRSR